MVIQFFTCFVSRVSVMVDCVEVSVFLAMLLYFSCQALFLSCFRILFIYGWHLHEASDWFVS